MRITLLDNDESLLRSLRIILGQQGHRVRCFTDPRAALAALADNVIPDILLVDWVMPWMSGREFLAAAEPKLPASCRKAIVTGHAEQIDEAQLEAMGVETLFAKPLDLARLRAFIGPGDEDRKAAKIESERHVPADITPAVLP